MCLSSAATEDATGERSAGGGLAGREPWLELWTRGPGATALRACSSRGASSGQALARAQKTRRHDCLSSSITVSFVLSTMQHDVHSVKPHSIQYPRLLTIPAYLDNWTHSLMPRDTAHNAFVTFTCEVEDGAERSEYLTSDL